MTLTSFITDEHKTLEIGARAHDFKLQGIIEPGGKVIYAKEGAFDVETLKKVIFDDPMIARIYNQ